MALDRAAILAETELKRETVKLKSGDVLLTELSGPDYMDAFEKLPKNDQGEIDGTELTALMIVRGIIDEDGNRLFTDEDADLFRKGSSGTFRKLAAAANRLNGLTGDEVKN